VSERGALRGRATNNAFSYDGLDRLLSHSVVTGMGGVVNVTYDQKGNITSKSDVGTYAYDPAKQHALTGVSGGPLGSQSYNYDANGNMISGGGRTITWTSFNQARSITQGSFTSTFSFGANRERVKQVSHLETTIYVGGVFEQVTPVGAGAVVEYKHYILAPTGRVAVHTDRSNFQRDVKFYHTDGLGSITAVTDEKGAIVKRFAFDAWGKRINPATGATITGATASGITRGYTDHEHLTDLGLVHMNGRVYDPVLARFISADPFIDGADDAQGFNRYSYVGNNPLNATDPSGYFKFKDILPAIAAIVVTAVVTVALGPEGGAAAFKTFTAFFSALKATAVSAAAFQTAGLYAVTAGGAAGGFASGFSGSLLNGGSLGDAFKAGVIGGVVGGATAFATAGIAHFFNGLEGAFAEGTLGNWTGRTLAHATVGGLSSEAQGGQFRHGFYSSAASTGIMHAKGVRSFMGGNKSGGWIAARTAVAATVGGTASVLAGGKFANGAVTSAFQHLFNSESAKLGDVRLRHAAIRVNGRGLGPGSKFFEGKAALLDFAAAAEHPLSPFSMMRGVPNPSDSIIDLPPENGPGLSDNPWVGKNPTKDMKKHHPEEQILRILKEAEQGKPLPELLRTHGIAAPTYYRWKSKYGGLELNQLRRLKELETENSRLKRLVADQALDIVMLKDVNAKNW
jgi:RHS repeat-associated protein